jgi:hypothetical protein
MLDPDENRELQDELESSERLLWSGKSTKGLMFRPTDIFAVPFSILWCGFAVYWIFGANNANAPPFFLAFGAVFVIAGLYFVFGRFIVDAMTRRRTIYGLTDRRAIVISGLLGRNARSVDLKSCSEITVRKSGGGTGTITFGPYNPMMLTGFGNMSPGGFNSPAFEAIENVSDVDRMVMDARRK